MNIHTHIRHPPATPPVDPGLAELAPPPSIIHLPPSTRLPSNLQPSAFSLQPSTRGAALLVVVGLISLLLITTMAFSVLMSIERSAASNYRHSVQARQLLYAGLAQAISDIDASVGNDAYPPWTNTTYGTIHPITRKQDVLQSIDTSVPNSAVCPAKVLSAEAMKYIPQSLYPAVQAVIPEYLPFAVTVAGQPYTVGRYAYVAANVSGLLDANTVATTNRWVGASASEIQIGNGLPSEITDFNKFLDDRDKYRRYESLKEMSLIGTNGLDPALLSNFETFSYAPPDTLAPDGSPKVFIGGTADQLRTNHVDIVAAFKKCFANSTPMIEFPDSDATAEMAYKSLVDYVDPGNVPEGATEGDRLARPAAKDVPQIQWVALLMFYNRKDDSTDPDTGVVMTYLHHIQYMLYVGYSRPFVSTNAGSSYTVSADATILDGGTSSTWKPLLPWNSGDTKSYSESGVQPSALSSAFITFPSDRFENIDVTADNTTPVPSIMCWFRVRVRITDDHTGQVVDQVPAGNGYDWATDNDQTHYIWMHFSKTFGPYNPAYSWYADASWAEAIDPTVNWDGFPDQGQWVVSDSEIDPSMPLHFYDVSLLHLRNDVGEFANLLISSDEASMIYETDAYATFWSNVRSSLAGGSLANYLLQNSPALTWWNANNGTKHIVPDGATLGADSSQWDPLIKQQRHYAKGAPLESVGELGYLPIGRWMTINLYPHGHNSIPVNSDNSPLLPPCGFHPVLDYFTVRPPNSIGRGLVNLGGQNTNVQACVFDQMPLDEWNGPGAAKKLEVDDARGFGHWLAAHCGSVTNLSDLGKFWSGADAQPLGEQDGLANNLSYPASILANRINDSLGIGEFEREAVIRNAVQLYTMRQQIYTIIVRADAMSFEYGMSDQNSVTANALNNGSVLSSAQAVFQVWRDPVADANGKHPCFVRLCKILSL